MKYIAALSVLFFLTTSCQDVIDVNLAEGADQLVVDAWINNLDQPQVISLTRTSPYFNSSAPPVELDATVTVTAEDGQVFEFRDPDNDGRYTWLPIDGVTFGEVGRSYTLDIETASGQKYQAISEMNRTTPVDSITATFEEESLGEPEGIYCEFFAIDPVGSGDAYWIKTFKNGQFLNKPQEMNIAFDAAFTQGAGVDGVTFITPIREAVNRVPDSGDDAVDDSDVAPWAEGDEIRVEIHSLTFEAFEFLQQAQVQMTAGDAGIFAEPPSNVPTNIAPIDSNDPDDQPIGFFVVSAVSQLSRGI